MISTDADILLHIGFHIEVNAQPVGRVYRAYKHAALALRTFA